MRSIGAKIFLLVALTAGCGRGDSSATPTTPTTPADNLQANGIRYDLPLTGSSMDRATEFLRAVRADGISWSGGGHTLEVAGGKIKLDGKDHGAVKQGDTVRLAPDGQLFVNGHQRHADEK
jgi:hypothetical protein